MKKKFGLPDASSFQQITLSDVSDMLGDERIYSKLDNVTIMFKDLSINKILEFIKCRELISEFLESWIQCYANLSDVIRFNYAGCVLEVRKGYLYGQNLSESTFSLTLPEIRLELTGQGLDFLRSRGINCESYFRNPTNYPGERSQFHLTRMDFAYDLINYSPELVDTLIKHIQDEKTDTDRVVIYSQSSALRYSIKTGGEKTVYLGSPSSSRLLRIYDKRLQYIDFRTGNYIKDNPYNNPKSWIRIELQTRRDEANKIGFASDMSMESVFKYVHDKYCFACGSTTYSRRPCEWWSKLLDWSRIPQIIQNFDKVHYRDPRDAELLNFQARICGSFLVQSTVAWQNYGSTALENLIIDYLTILNDPTNDISLRRKTSLLLRLELDGVDLSGNLPGLFLYDSHGVKLFGYRSPDKVICGYVEGSDSQ